ncbi:unnamed protein product [Lactuca saligna]|uniref:Uncharacterized protein n=1 Tax=Lactuca saligna TaxID=75948 RepID=A0AA35Z4L3_LACSI|nr:unnamed protein product [Lactuca saligna]
MLRRVDPTNPVLVAYLTTINPSIGTGVLLSKDASGPSKKSKASKKGVKASPSKPSIEPVVNVFASSPKKVVMPIVDEFSNPSKEVMPLKSGVLKRLKKMAHKPSGKDAKSKNIRKPQLNSKVVVIRELPTLVSPSSKK